MKRRSELIERMMAYGSPGDEGTYKLVCDMEDKIIARDAALLAIQQITEATHTGQERAYTALSKIDQLVRKALS